VELGLFAGVAGRHCLGLRGIAPTSSNSVHPDDNK
jgi:hypothetical protein